MTRRERAPRSAAAAALAALALIGCADLPFGPGGDAPVLLTRGEAHAGSIQPGTAQLFVVESSAGASLRIILEGTSRSRHDSLVAEVRSESSGAKIGTIGSDGGQEAPRDRRLLIAATAEPRRYTILVRGATPEDGGEFRLLSLDPDFGPEALDTAIVVGDTVTGERFDAFEDFDRFEFEGEAGAHYVLALEMADERAGRTVHLQLLRKLGPDSFDEYFRFALPWTPRAFESGALRARLTTSGTHVVSVFHEVPWWEPDPPPTVVDGRYRLLVRKVDTLPEGRPPGFAVGDTIVGAIEEAGDIDVYTASVVAGLDYRLDVSWDRTLGAPLLLGVFAPAFEHGEELVVPPTRLDGLGWSFRPPVSGPVRLRLLGGAPGARDSVTAAYRLELRRIQRTPESRSTLLGRADSIATEAIERAGDIDEFSFSQDSGAVTAIRVTREPGFEGQLLVQAAMPDGDILWSRELNDTTGTFVTRLPNVPGTTITLRVAGVASSRGAYRIETGPVDHLPEVVPSALTLGAWSDWETTDASTDIDEFTFPLVAGRQYSAAIELAPGSEGQPGLWMVRPGVELASGFTYPWMGGALNPFTATTSGTAAFRIEADGFAPATYRVIAFAIDSAPESVAASRAVGDTISGESIDLPGDVDEFLVAAVGGDKFELEITWPDRPELTRMVIASLYHPVSGEFVTGSSPGSTNLVLLADSGTYRLRVRAHPPNLLATRDEYRVVMRRVP